MVLDSRTCIKVKFIQSFRAVYKIIQDGRQKNIDLDCSGCCCLIGFIFVSLSTFKIVEIKENENTSLQIQITYYYYCIFSSYFVTINAFLANYWRSTSCPVEHAKFQCMAIQVLAVLYLICHQLVS